MSNGSFGTTPQERYLEDYVEGTVHEFGPVTITEDEIVQLNEVVATMMALNLIRYRDVG